MATACIIIGLCVAICVIIIASSTNKDKQARADTPPDLPPRFVIDRTVRSIDQNQVKTNKSVVVPALPPRNVFSSSALTNNLGPRGLHPDQFPCCPYDKERNVTGEPQLVFWDRYSNCYRCSRGHRFKSNGKLL